MSNRLAISTMSIGRAWHHDLTTKLEAAAQHGYEGIELFYEDLEYHARGEFNGTAPDELLLAASDIRELCSRLKLQIICLQPLMHFEGLRDAADRRAALEKAELWCRLANTLATEVVAVPSNFLSADKVTGDRSVIVSDLQELADLAQVYNIRLVYEALAWGTHIDRWEQSWSVVQAVDRPNFGICLDTFNIAGRIFADPTSPTGMTEDAEDAVQASLQQMVATIDREKVFYIQLVDAERLAQPLDKTHEFYDASQPARMSWSRNCRLFYGEHERGAYLPVRQIMRTVMEDIGFRGWISMELFNRSMADPDPLTPARHAQRGAIAWERLRADFSSSFLQKVDHTLVNESESRSRAML